MYKHKKSCLKKGYIAVYTLIICSFCMVLVFYSFYMEVKRSRHVNSYKNFVIKTKKYDEYKEYAFTYVQRQITEGVNNLTYNDVKQYFIINNFKTKFDYDRACIKYDSNSNKIALETYYDEDYFRRDLYDFKVVDDKLKYEYIKTTYIKGRIE